MSEVLAQLKKKGGSSGMAGDTFISLVDTGSKNYASGRTYSYTTTKNYKSVMVSGVALRDANPAPTISITCTSGKYSEEILSTQILQDASYGSAVSGRVANKIFTNVKSGAVIKYTESGNVSTGYHINILGQE